jgi:hypothetical protein
MNIFISEAVSSYRIGLNGLCYYSTIVITNITIVNFLFDLERKQIKVCADLW